MERNSNVHYRQSSYNSRKSESQFANSFFGADDDNRRSQDYKNANRNTDSSLHLNGAFTDGSEIQFYPNYKREDKSSVNVRQSRVSGANVIPSYDSHAQSARSLGLQYHRKKTKRNPLLSTFSLPKVRYNKSKKIYETNCKPATDLKHRNLPFSKRRTSMNHPRPSSPRKGQSTRTSNFLNAPVPCFVATQQLCTWPEVEFALMCKIFFILVTLFWLTYLGAISFDADMYAMLSQGQLNDALTAFKIIFGTTSNKLYGTIISDTYNKLCVLAIAANLTFCFATFVQTRCGIQSLWPWSGEDFCNDVCSQKYRARSRSRSRKSRRSNSSCCPPPSCCCPPPCCYPPPPPPPSSCCCPPPPSPPSCCCPPPPPPCCYPPPPCCCPSDCCCVPPECCPPKDTIVDQRCRKNDNFDDRCCRNPRKNRQKKKCCCCPCPNPCCREDNLQVDPDAYPNCCYDDGDTCNIFRRSGQMCKIPDVRSNESSSTTLVAIPLEDVGASNKNFENQRRRFLDNIADKQNLRIFTRVDDPPKKSNMIKRQQQDVFL